MLCVYASHATAQIGFISADPDRIGPIDESERVTLKGNVHPLARKQADEGSVPASTPTGSIRLVLQRSQEQQQALTQYLSDVQNPLSSAYHKWLTPRQYGVQFGVSDSDLLRVQDWLRSHGFKIENVPRAHNVVEFSGTIDQVQSTFHTAIHRFSVNGEEHFANISDPQIPTALAPVVAGVGPLNDFRPKPMLLRGPDGRFDPSTNRIIPELTLTSNNSSYLFVDPADAAIIYDTPNKVLNPGYTGTTYDGTGVAIGIVGVSDLTSADVANYRMAFLGESSGSMNLPTVIVDGNDPGLNGAGAEALLDTEIAGGIAPKAKLYFYTSADTDLSSGLMNALFRALDDNTVSILSMSFSSCEATLGTSGNQVMLEASEQAAAQGISLTVSSGDNGSAGCDNFDTETQATHGFGVNGFASTPYTIAVGGTDFDVLSTSFVTYVNNTTSGSAPYYATALKYIPENPWNDSTSVNSAYSNNVPRKDSQGNGNIIAGSGGVSSVYSKPSFQTSLTPQDGFRDIPDVSLLAGNGLYNAAWVLCSDNITDGSTQNYTECQTTNGQFTSSTVFGGAGGTSAAAPAFAGMLALVAQAHGSASDNYRLGQADDILYQLAQSQYSTVFHDVTTGNNSVPCTSGLPNCGSNGFLTGYNAGQKYDLASGLGSVDVAAMVNNWTSVALSSTSTSLTINGSAAAYTGIHGQSLKFDVNVTPSSATGTVGIVDNANEVSGGAQNNGQFAIPITGGAGSATYNGLPGGSYSVWGRYGGDTVNASSTSTPSINVTITPEASTTTLSVQAYDATGKPISLTNVPFGSYVFADAQIVGAAEGANTQGVATGSVSFTDGTATLGTAPVSSGNQASWPPITNSTPIKGGSHQLVANYSGDASYGASASQPVAFTVVPAQTNMQPQTTSGAVNSTQSVSVDAFIYSPYFAGVPPTGSASVLLNNKVLATTSVNSAETGSPGAYEWFTFGYLTVPAGQLPPGENTLTVSYSGDSNYASSTGTVTIDSIAPGGGATISGPAGVTLSAGSNVSSTSTVTLTPSGGYTGWINWGCYVSPSSSGLNCWIPETHVPLSGPVDTLLVISGNAIAGTYTVNINGTDNTTDGINIVKTVQITVGSAAAPGLAVMNNGPLTISAGASTGGTSNVTIVPSGGFSGQVNLACAVTTSIVNPQSAPTCSVPGSINLNAGTPAIAQVQVSTTSSTTAGSYSVAVTATSTSTSTITTTDNVTLAVTASPSFSITSSGLVNISVGSSNSNAATVTLSPLNGYSGSVQLSCFLESAFYDIGSTLPTCTVPSSVQVSPGSPTTINVSLNGAGTTQMGFYLMTVTTFDPNSQLGFDTSLDVVEGATPSFTLSNSGAIQVTAGATSGNTGTISVIPANGFMGNVNLACSVSTAIVGAQDTPGCSLNPAVVNVNGTAAVTSTLTISTTGRTSGAAIPFAKPFRLGAAIPVLALVFLFGVRSKRRGWVRMVGSLLLILWMGTMGCGGGGGSGGGGGTGGNSGTTPGNYSVKVTATDAASGKITAQTTWTVTVN